METIFNFFLNYWFEIILFINLIIIFTVIFIERKSPYSAITWVITLAVLPIFGIIFYILFGSKPRFYKKKKFQRKGVGDKIYQSQLYSQIQTLQNGSHISTNPSAIDNESLIKLNAIGAGSLYTEGNDIRIITNAKEKYANLIEDIRQAKSSIHIIYFIFRDDDIGTLIVEELTKKVKEGLSVRVIIDDVGSFSTRFEKLFAEFKKAGGEFRAFSPRFRIDRLNYRNHRKIVVIDGEIGYVGGMNIGNEYMGMRERMSSWRDTHLRIIGPAVYMLQIRFLLDWSYAIGTRDLPESFETLFPENIPIMSKNIGVQIVSSGPDKDDQYIKNAYMRMFFNAKKAIYIQTPYFIPDQAFLESLKMMAMQGIEIHLMIPGVYDKFFTYQATWSYIGELIDYKNVTVYLYNGFLHSKSVAIDESVTSIGTCNLDIRSFDLHFEINAFVYDKDFTEEHLEIYEEDIRNSRVLSAEEYHKRPLHKKFLEAITRLISPLL